MIYMNDLMEKCSKEGISITRMGLYIAGKREGFIYKENDEYEFDKKKFLSWVEKVKEKVPQGWVNFVELSEIINKSVSNCYAFVKDKNIEVRRFGAKQVMYVERKAVEEAIRNNNGKHKYVWDDENE